MTKDWEVKNATFWKFLCEAGAQRKVTFKNLMNFLDMEIRLNVGYLKVFFFNCHLETAQKGSA